MRLLLDTHSFLWFVLDDSRVSQTALRLIGDPANSVYVSAASLWEIAIKVGLGKLKLNSDYDSFVQEGLVGYQFTLLPVEPKHTALLINLPQHHKDPFDRLLVVQGIAEGMALISCDVALDAYSIQRIW